MKYYNGIPVWGVPDEGALKQIQTCAETADYVALMGDNHQGYAVPIGGVVAYLDAISPSGVGYDIGCGNKAVKLQDSGTRIRPFMDHIMDEIWNILSFGVGQKNNVRVNHSLFDSPTWSHPAVAPLKEMARDQLGTIGSGNHYVDIFHDEDNYVWVGVHFGSRGLGHKIATYFLKAGGATDGIFSEPLVVPVDSYLGQDYLACMELAGQYAYAGRDWVCKQVAWILGADIVDEVHNHHNFAWRERHLGSDLWVVRKGSTPAFPGQRGFVGGSMGEPAVILEGVESDESATALYSTVHGAGRVMSRSQAKGKMKNGEVVREGLVTQKMMQEWVQNSGVVLRGAGVDESPHCYKRLNEVLTYHQNTVKILHTLYPMGVAMAGNEFDPYKD